MYRLPVIEGPVVGLEAMLAARERRAAMQRELLAAGGTLISYTLNIAGPVKRYPLADRAFGEGRGAILAELGRRRWPVLLEHTTDADTGLEAMWTTDIPPMEVKAAMTAIEEGHGLGRLFDIDVIGPGGEKLNRAGLGFPPRGCLVCGEPGPGCARSRAHSLEELSRSTLALMQGYFERAAANRIAQNAVRALLYEVSVTPKPGLVDRHNNGAHHDMDFFTFIDSAAALTGYFRDMALAGLRHRDIPANGLLPYLRYRGITAEADMFAATGGVNTHKGLIFSLGLVAAACGWLTGTPGAHSPEAILTTAGQIAAPITADLVAITGENASTHGERLYAAHRIGGVREQATLGFPAVREIGLPVLREMLKRGCSLNDASVAVLLHLIAGVEDTNIIARSDFNTQLEIRRKMSDYIAFSRNTEDYASCAHALDADFITAHISPGGCADLLAITLMLYFTGQSL